MTIYLLNVNLAFVIRTLFAIRAVTHDDMPQLTILHWIVNNNIFVANALSRVNDKRINMGISWRLDNIFSKHLITAVSRETNWREKKFKTNVILLIVMKCWMCNIS